MMITPKFTSLVHHFFSAPEYISSYIVSYHVSYHVHTEHIPNPRRYFYPISFHSGCFSFHVLFPISMACLLSTWLAKQQLRHHISPTVHIHSKPYWVSSSNTVIIYSFLHFIYILTWTSILAFQLVSSLIQAYYTGVHSPKYLWVIFREFMNFSGIKILSLFSLTST